MIAARFHGPGSLRLEERPLPEPGIGEVRVLPRAVGLCGTDLHIVRGEFPASPPVVLGHEIAGVVDRIGRDVRNVAEGDRVTVEPHVYCGICRFCRLGREHLCLEKRAIGVHLDGGLAEALVVPARCVYRLPRECDPRIGCLAEPVACCIHGMDRLAPRSGEPLLVIGAGPAGLILSRLARLRGVRPLVVVERSAARRDAARVFGADQVLDPADEGWRDIALELTAGHGFDAVIEAVGAAETVETAIALAARGGSILIFGAAPATVVARVRPYEIFAKELSLIGSVINPYTHQRAVDLLPALGLDALALATFPLDRVHDAFEAHASGAASKVEVLTQREGWA